MSIQSKSKLVRYWADNHLIVTGTKFLLIDNQSQEILLQSSASDPGLIHRSHRETYKPNVPLIKHWDNNLAR